MDKTEALNSIVAEANRGELVFSTNVTASLKIQQALDAPDCSTDTAAKLVMNEPLLSARVVAIANSVAYNRGNDVTNVKSAIARLGFRTLRSIVATLVVRQLAGASKNPETRAKANQLWEHTAQVAALSQVIARRITKLDPDTAMFAGVVHEVGGFYLLSRVEEFPCLLDNKPDPLVSDLPAFSDTIIESTEETPETIIGRVVLKNLMLPQPVLDAVEALWFGLRAMPPETLGDTLLLANELASIRSPLEMRFETEPNQYASEIDFVVGDGTLNSILEESEEEVRSLTAALLA
ncbi:HDOD domain-containing protein [Undibacterium sp. Xuan67W]|uniref:HDOD domain-containing protein n=1 Tax=Undibacterium sp. Xuan67W TaxID=3413057 RepID=UPI003BF04E72